MISWGQSYKTYPHSYTYLYLAVMHNAVSKSNVGELRMLGKLTI